MTRTLTILLATVLLAARALAHGDLHERITGVTAELLTNSDRKSVV